jgi:hypothetical protein
MYLSLLKCWVPDGGEKTERPKDCLQGKVINICQPGSGPARRRGLGGVGTVLGVGEEVGRVDGPRLKKKAAAVIPLHSHTHGSNNTIFSRLIGSSTSSEPTPFLRLTASDRLWQHVTRRRRNRFPTTTQASAFHSCPPSAAQRRHPPGP